MNKVVELAENIKTPLSLAALALLLSFIVLRYITSRLRIESVESRDVSVLLFAVLRGMFWLTLVSVVLAISSYILTALFDPTPKQVKGSILSLTSNSYPERVAAIGALRRISVGRRDFDEEICSGLSAFVRTGPRERERLWAVYPQDRLAAIVLVSDLSRDKRCEKVDFSQADLRRAVIGDLFLPGTNFLQAWLDEVVFLRAELSTSSFGDASLDHADLTGASLARADFTEASLDETILECADLSHSAGFDGIDLLSTRLDGANLRGTDFSNAKFDRRRGTSSIGDQVC